MTDDKTEELKLALKKTFNQDHSLKQDLKKENKPHLNSKEINNGHKKTINNFLMYILIFINFILICIIFYVLIEKNIKPIVKEKSVLLNTMNNKNKQNSGKNLSKENTYKLKEKYMKQIVLMDEEIKHLKQDHATQIILMNKKIKILGHLKTKNIATVSSLDVKKLFHSEKFKLLKCYKSKKGSNILSKSCKKSISIFINKNKNSARFEVIGVIAKDDDVLFKKLNKNNLSENIQKTIREYLFKGLARERVLEAFWHITEVLKSDIILIPTNYYVKSIKESKGILIKAYY